jgi:hypothetical protein
MADAVTPDQVVEAAKELGEAEFTRPEIATKLNVDREELKEGFRAARKDGRIEKVAEGGEGKKPTFRLTDK